MNKEKLRPYLRRLMVVFLISLIASIVINEVSFRMLPHNIDRAPQTIEMVIPEGTAELVAAGQPVPSIPEEWVFVLGDVLVVNNQDSVSHELGPLLIPPGTTASMPMDQVDSIAVTCSFTSANYLGFEVKEPTDLGTRALRVSFAAPATTVILYLYSLIAIPVDKKKKETESTK